MSKNNYRVLKEILIPSLVAILFLVTLHCSTGVEPSPDPGTLRVTLEADPTDSVIVVAEDTMYANDGDSMLITIFQGKAYNRDDYAILYQNPKEYFALDHNYNILKRENGKYKRFIIFESFVPPGNYTKLQFGITAKYALLTYGYYIGGIGIPMESAPGANLLVDLDEPFTIAEGRTTEINVVLKPFQSVFRYQDLLRFVPKIQISQITNP